MAQSGIVLISTERGDGHDPVTAALRESSDATQQSTCPQEIDLCSFLIGKYKADSDDDEVIKRRLILAYSQEARSIANFRSAIIKRRRATGHGATTPPPLLHEKPARVASVMQQSAGDSLALITSQSLMRALDHGSLGTEESKATVLGCEEYDILLKASDDGARVKSVYADTLDLFIAFFHQHTCRI